MDYVGAEIATGVNRPSYIYRQSHRTTSSNYHVVPHADTVYHFTILTTTAGTTYDNSHTMPSIAEHIHSVTTLISDLHFYVTKDGSEVDIQILLYVLAVVMFYGLILLVALMGQRTRWRRQISLEDNHSSHIDRHEIVRKYTVLRQKINMLWLSGIHRGYMRDSFRKKSNMSFAFDWYDIGIYNSLIMKLFKSSSPMRTAWAYAFRENRECVFIIIVQFMMSANIWIYSFVCTVYHLIIIIVQTYLKPLNL